MSILADKLGIDEATERIFVDLWKFYEKESHKFNFTSIKNKKEFEVKHFIDSILAVKDIDFIKPLQKVLDIGTGGGFPGIPLSILYPDTKFVLLDSVGKNTDLLERVRDEFGLKNVEVINARAEELAHDKAQINKTVAFGAGENKHRGNYDCVLNRALAKWDILLELSLAFLKIGGHLLAYKGKETVETLAKADKLARIFRGKLLSVKNYELPYGFGQRCVVIFVKEAPTKIEFPRKMALIKKRPIILNDI